MYANLKQKHVGIGNENTTKEEWVANVKRDTYHSLLAHSGLLEYTTMARNQSQQGPSYTKKQMKWELLNKMGHSGSPQ